LPSWEDIHLRTDPSNEALDQNPDDGGLPPASAELDYFSAVGHPYLRERKITAFTTAALGLRYDRVLQRILFPVRDYRGRFAGFSGRSVIGPAYFGEDDKPYDRHGDKYLKVKDYCGLRKLEFLLGEDTVLRLGSRYPKPAPIIVCEGLFDFAWLRQLGYWSTVATMGTWLTEPKIRRLRSYNRPIIPFMDNDEAGRNARDEIVRAFWGHAPVLDVTYPEEMEDADPHALPPVVVHNMLRNTRLVTTAPLTNNVATASF
jgi:DNA primase